MVLSLGQAALVNGKEGETTRLFVEVAEVDIEDEAPKEAVQKYLLCNLCSGRVDQYSLNVTFFNGQKITFHVEGPGEIHITGLLDELASPYPSDSEEEELDSSFASMTDDQLKSFLKARASMFFILFF